jgi:LPS-assembly lipoprotein
VTCTRAARLEATLAATLAAIFAAVVAVPLAACGFHLRASQPLPFASLYLSFGPNSPLGTELARTIRAGTPTVVTTERAKAQAIFEVQSETREREVLSVNAQGQPVEYQLRVRLTFRVHDGKGRDFIAPTQLLAQRDISFNETQILAKESEESLLFRDMQTDLVQQLLRRLAAAKI